MTQYQQQHWPRDITYFIEASDCHFKEKLVSQHPLHTKIWGWRMQLADGIGSHRNRFVIGIHEPCVSRNATGTLWDSDLQAVCKLAGEMKLHRRANTRNPGRTAYWRICRKCCLAAERSARAGSIRGWAGLLDLEDIPGSGLLWGKGKDILGTEDQHEWWLRFRPLWGLFLGQCKDQSDEGWDVHWGNMGQTIGGLNGWEEEFSGRWEAAESSRVTQTRGD